MFAVSVVALAACTTNSTVAGGDGGSGGEASGGRGGGSSSETGGAPQGGDAPTGGASLTGGTVEGGGGEGTGGREPAPGPLAVLSDDLPAQEYNQRVELQLEAEGGVTPRTWELTKGALPKGLTLSADGVISGYPEVALVASFEVTVTDAAGASVSRALTLSVLRRESGILLTWVPTADTEAPDFELGVWLSRSAWTPHVLDHVGYGVGTYAVADAPLAAVHWDPESTGSRNTITIVRIGDGLVESFDAAADAADTNAVSFSRAGSHLAYPYVAGEETGVRVLAVGDDDVDEVASLPDELDPVFVPKSRGLVTLDPTRASLLVRTVASDDSISTASTALSTEGAEGGISMGGREVHEGWIAGSTYADGAGNRRAFMLRMVGGAADTRVVSLTDLVSTAYTTRVEERRLLNVGAWYDAPLGWAHPDAPLAGIYPYGGTRTWYAPGAKLLAWLQDNGEYADVCAQALEDAGSDPTCLTPPEPVTAGASGHELALAGNRYVVAAADGSLWVFPVSADGADTPTLLDAGPVSAFSISPDGRAVLFNTAESSATDDGELVLARIADDESVTTKVVEDSVNGGLKVVWTGDSSIAWFATDSSPSGTMGFVDVVAKKVTYSLTHHGIFAGPTLIETDPK